MKMAMTRACVYAVSAAAVMLCGAPVCRAQKTTIDPNAGRTTESAVDVGDGDSRLAQKISYETWHTPVKVIFADLSQRTGVTLHAGWNVQDWQIRDRRMNILVRDVTLSELMGSISRVMEFKWSRSDDVKPPTYRLRADRRLLTKLEVEASRRANELAREVSRRRAELLDEFTKLSSGSGAETAKLREENPYLYTCARTGFAKLVTQMFGEMPRLRDMFIGGDRNVIFPIKTLSTSTQQLYADVLRKSDTYDSSGKAKALPDKLESELENACVHMELVPRPDEYNLRRQLSYFGGMGTQLSTGHTVLGGFEAVSSQPDKADLKRAKETEYYLMFDPVVEHSDQPGLHEKITPKISEKAKQALADQSKALSGHGVARLEYQAAQKAVAEAASTCIVSDSFNVVLGEYQPDGKEAELVNVLDAFSNAYGCNWEKHGSILEFRRRDWFRQRSSQIPDEWVNGWRDELNQTGTLQLNTYAQMATLSQEQKEENITSDPMLDEALGVWWAALNNEGLLRFYLRLTPALRNAMFSEQGLDPHMLNPDQWRSYAEMFHYGRRWAWDTEAFSAPDCRALVKASCVTTEAKPPVYSFAVNLESDGGTRSDSWSIPMPRIVLPVSK